MLAGPDFSSRAVAGIRGAPKVRHERWSLVATRTLRIGWRAAGRVVARAAGVRTGRCLAREGASPINEVDDAGPIAPTPAIPGASSDGGDGDGGGEPPPPPCDAAQTAAIQASFVDEAIPNEVGAVAVVKDPSCGVRYFTRGASKDVPETALHLIGSTTKTYIASLILLLVEEGKVSLSDPVTKWIPDVPGGDAVKVEHLLHHTSGIYNYTGNVSYMLGIMLGLHTKYTPRALLDLAFSKPPSFAAGTAGKWEYSNTNYVLLGMIIESVTGKGVAQVLRERILTPISAKATSFNGSEPLKGEVAYGRTFLGSNGATFMDPSASWGAGNLVATIGDLVDWEEKRGSGAFHSAAMQAEMLKGAPTGADFTYGAALVIVGETEKVLNLRAHDDAKPTSKRRWVCAIL
jgi:CubicO group peptidase (beta-lactamase class C family)